LEIKSVSLIEEDGNLFGIGEGLVGLLTVSCVGDQKDVASPHAFSQTLVNTIWTDTRELVLSGAWGRISWEQCLELCR
jgi:hypothetical protein